MRIDVQLRLLCAKSNLSISEIGRRLDKSPQAFSQKIKRGTLSIDDLGDIAMVSGCTLECSFLYPDGTRIKIK